MASPREEEKDEERGERGLAREGEKAHQRNTVSQTSFRTHQKTGTKQYAEEMSGVTQ